MWEIYSYHNSEALPGVLNAIAGIMGSATFLGSLASVAFCGFCAAIAAYAFAPDKLHGWKWIGTVLLVYSLLIVPKVTVGVVDKTGGGPVKIVDNVPAGLAALGGLTSTIGNATTELFETAFQVIPGSGSLPAELAYQRNGLMFGSRVVQESRRVAFPDPSVRVDVINYLSNCTVYDINDQTISAADFSTSADLWTLIGSTNPARFTPITTSSGLTAVTCTDAYSNLSARIAPQVATLTARLALRLNPTLDTTNATAAVENQLTQAYIRSQIADASASAASLVRQNALINAVSDAGEMGCQRINDPSCMMLATARATAVAGQNASWINGAKVAEQALPVVRNAAEALCYAVFPLVVLLLMLSTGRTTLLMVGGYVTALISIQLWPPLFAILNYMATLYAQLDQAAAAEVGGGLKALSLQTASPIYSNAVSAQAVVSYLVVAIPVLAYSLANRLVGFGSSVVGGLTSLQSAVGSASAASAVGNASMGNVSMDQRVVSPSTSSPWTSRQQDMGGNWVTTAGDGSTAIDFLRNSGAVSNRITASVTQNDVQEASRAVESARSDVVSASNERASALTDTLSRISARSASQRSGSGQSTSSFEEIGRSADQVKQLSSQVSATTGMSQSQVQQIGFKLAAGLGAPKGFPIKLEGGASAGKTYSGSLTAGEQQVLNALGTEGVRAFKQFGDRATRDSSFLQSLASESRDGKELASRLSESTSQVESAQAALSQREGAALRLSTAHARGQEMSIDLAQLPVNSQMVQRYHQLASEYGPSSQALRIAMAAEMANYSTTPTPAFSDGAAVPASFQDVRERHAARALDPTLDKRHVEAADVAHYAKTKPRLVASPMKPVVGREMASLRDDVGAQNRVETQVRDRIADFDARNEITRDDAGTVGTRKSQLFGNGRQIIEDVANVGENARELLDGLTEGKAKSEPERN